MRKVAKKKKQELFTFNAMDVWFYAQGDETAFHDWLKRIPCVVKVGGYTNIMTITVDLARADQASVCELLAIFYRYRMSMRQLRILGSGLNARWDKWFRNPGAYWYKYVFGTPRLYD